MSNDIDFQTNSTRISNVLISRFLFLLLLFVSLYFFFLTGVRIFYSFFLFLSLKFRCRHLYAFIALFVFCSSSSSLSSFFFRRCSIAQTKINTTITTKRHRLPVLYVACTSSLIKTKKKNFKLLSI